MMFEQLSPWFQDMGKAFVFFIHHAWLGLVIAGIGASTYWFRQYWSAASRYLALQICLFAVAAFPVLIGIAIPAMRQISYFLFPTPGTGTYLVPADANAFEMSSLVTSHDRIAAEGADAVFKAVPATSELSVGAKTMWLDPGAVALALWALPALFFLFRLVRSLHAADRLKRHARPVPVDGQLPFAGPIMTSTAIRTPMVVGLYRPCILLPENARTIYTEQELRQILEHEAGHIARKDAWWHLSEKVIAALFWYNPGVHWLCHQLSRLREQACDDRVVARQPGSSAVYARCLIKAYQYSGRTHSPVFSIKAVAGPKAFQRRIRALINGDICHAETPSGQTLLLVLPALAGLLLGAAMVTPQASLAGLYQDRRQPGLNDMMPSLIDALGKRYSDNPKQDMLRPEQINIELEHQLGESIAHLLDRHHIEAFSPFLINDPAGNLNRTGPSSNNSTTLAYDIYFNARRVDAGRVEFFSASCNGLQRVKNVIVAPDSGSGLCILYPQIYQHVSSQRRWVLSTGRLDAAAIDALAEYYRSYLDRHGMLRAGSRVLSVFETVMAGGSDVSAIRTNAGLSVLGEVDGRYTLNLRLMNGGPSPNKYYVYAQRCRDSLNPTRLVHCETLGLPRSPERLARNAYQPRHVHEVLTEGELVSLIEHAKRALNAGHKLSFHSYNLQAQRDGSRPISVRFAPVSVSPERSESYSASCWLGPPGDTAADRPCRQSKAIAFQHIPEQELPVMLTSWFASPINRQTGLLSADSVTRMISELHQSEPVNQLSAESGAPVLIHSLVGSCWEIRSELKCDERFHITLEAGGRYYRVDLEPLSLLAGRPKAIRMSTVDEPPSRDLYSFNFIPLPDS